MNTALLEFALGGATLGSAKTDRWLKVLIQMLDVACEEYERARQLWSLHGTTSDSGVAFTLPAAGVRLEICVICLRRGLRCLSKLPAACFAAPNDDTARDRLRELERLLGPSRNAIEHIDDRIQEGLSSNCPHILAISPDGAVARIGRKTLDLSTLRESIILLHQVAESLLASARRRGEASRQPGPTRTPEAPSPNRRLS